MRLRPSSVWNGTGLGLFEWMNVSGLCGRLSLGLQSRRFSLRGLPTCTGGAKRCGAYGVGIRRCWRCFSFPRLPLRRRRKTSERLTSRKRILMGGPLNSLNRSRSLSTGNAVKSHTSHKRNFRAPFTHFSVSLDSPRYARILIVLLGISSRVRRRKSIAQTVVQRSFSVSGSDNGGPITGRNGGADTPKKNPERSGRGNASVHPQARQVAQCGRHGGSVISEKRAELAEQGTNLVLQRVANCVANSIPEPARKSTAGSNPERLTPNDLAKTGSFPKPFVGSSNLPSPTSFIPAEKNPKRFLSENRKVCPRSQRSCQNAANKIGFLSDVGIRSSFEQ